MAPDTGYLVPARVISSVWSHPYEVCIYITREMYNIFDHFKILHTQHTKTSNTWKGDSHLKHNSLTSTIPCLPYSPYLLHTSARCPQFKSLPFTACFCTLTRPPTLSPSVIMAQTISKPNLFPYNTPNMSPAEFILHAPACLWRWNRQSDPKRRHKKFRCRGITQKKEYKNLSCLYHHIYICTYKNTFLGFLIVSQGKYDVGHVIYSQIYAIFTV